VPAIAFRQAAVTSPTDSQATFAPRNAARRTTGSGLSSKLRVTGAFQADGSDSRWYYWVDAQARYFDMGSGINQWLVRPAVGYAINDNLKGWLGYARFRSRSRSGDVGYEDRYWQQLDWSAGHWVGGRVAMRARLEQRSVSVGDEVGVVLRFMAKYVRPIGDDGGSNLVVSLEPFFNLSDTDWSGESGLKQNRVFIGFDRRLSEHLTLEAGYMNQYIWVDHAADRSNHLAVFSFKAKL
jgi:hypothetical protein